MKIEHLVHVRIIEVDFSAYTFVYIVITEAGRGAGGEYLLGYRDQFLHSSEFEGVGEFDENYFQRLLIRQRPHLLIYIAVDLPVVPLIKTRRVVFGVGQYIIPQIPVQKGGVR